MSPFESMVFRIGNPVDFQLASHVSLPEVSKPVKGHMLRFTKLVNLKKAAMLPTGTTGTDHPRIVRITSHV